LASARKRAKTKKMPKEMRAEPPRLASSLFIIGGIMVLICAIIWIFVTSTIASLPIPPNANASVQAFGPALSDAAGIAEDLGIVSVLFGALMIVSGVKVNSSNPNEIRTWSLIGLVSSLLSLLSFGGFIMGTGLGVVAAVIGLKAKAY
jgi:hypothetical protein